MYIVSIIIGAVEMFVLWIVSPLFNSLASSLLGRDTGLIIDIAFALVLPAVVVFWLLNSYKTLQVKWPKIDKSGIFIGMLFAFILLFIINLYPFWDFTSFFTI